MNFNDFIIPFINFILYLPTTLLCVAPAKNHLRVSIPKIVMRLSLVSVCVSAVLAFITAYFKLDYSLVYYPLFLIIFITYHRCLTIHISQSVSLFLVVAAFNSFLNNFSILFDAKLNPTNTLVDFSPMACAFLLIITLLFCVLASFPGAKYGAFLIDSLPQPRIWWIVAFISAVFFIFNQRMIIHNYSTLHTNMVGIAYITVMILMFVLLILLCVILYFIVNALLEKAEAEDRNRILELQKNQYHALKRFIDNDARARHDFRQTLYTLNELSEEKDYGAIDEFISRYIEKLPKKETADFCENNAINALLNHYATRCEVNNIRSEIKVSLPSSLKVDEVVMCTVIGNIFENAIIACCDIPEDKRYIHLAISEEMGNEIYIAMNNSFSGDVKQRAGRYLSTHKGGNGIGLISVAATASAYGGTAEFTHDESIFYSNIMLVNK